MSTDFTGKNKKIDSDSLYMTVSDCLSRYLGIDRDRLYKRYTKIGACNGSGVWGYFDRYNKAYNSNDYVGNSLDDLVILKQAIKEAKYEDKDLETAESRKESLNAACSSLIRDGLCDNFTVSGLFPHLDCPGEIVSIQGVSGFIPCIEPSGAYETLYATISYTDSCGEGFTEPVPYYPLSWNELSGDITQKSTLDDPKWNISADYQWEITRNMEEVKIEASTSSMIENHLNVSTLSTAFQPDIGVTLTYTEKE